MPLETDLNPEGIEEEAQVEQAPPRFRDVFSQLPMFEDLYMGMQAMNLDIVDDVLEQQEAVLLREYMELERTPVPQALLVSALSQLWVFGMYELLRTWRQRVNDVLKFTYAAQKMKAAERKKFVDARRRKVKRITKHAIDSPWRYFAKTLRSKKFLSQLENAIDRSELAFRRIEALRISLAKHEVPRSDGMAAMAPGYGRIDMTDGSIYWQIVLEGREVDLISRRRIASDCRRLSLQYSETILPRALQQKLKGFPRHSYALKRVKVTLKSKQIFDGVLVAWDKQVVFVEKEGKIPFAAKEIVEIQSSPHPLPSSPRKKPFSA
jgi:hypothetical protein